MAVDELDTRILRLLLEQPRTSVREYARVLGVARGTLQARLDRLERDGVITGTGPSLSPAALGHPVLAFVHIEVTQGHLDEVGNALATVPEIGATAVIGLIKHRKGFAGPCRVFGIY